MTDWAKGYSAHYQLMRVSPDSWGDVEELRLTGGKITRTDGDLIESASLDMTESPEEIWIRVYLDARQNGEDSRVALFTGLTSAPERKLDGRRESYSVSCYSVVKPAADRMLPRGWFAPTGVAAARLARTLLQVGPAPVHIEDGSPALAATIVAEDEETNLTMAHKIVDAAGWRIRISGDGAVYIGPSSDEPAAELSELSGDCIGLSVSDQRDWYSCPNVFRAVQDDQSAVARDDDPKSPLSTVSRGREIWQQETSVDLAAGQSLEQYAAQRLKELQQTERTVSYDRRYIPGVYPGSAVRIRYPSVKINGKFRVTSQTITLGYSAETSEEATEI